MGTFPHKKPPPRRHADRRAGAATAAFREGLNGSLDKNRTLSPDALRLARQRRDRYAERNELPAWLASRTGRVMVGLVAGVVLLGICVAGVAAVVNIIVRI
ncbi:MAG: hypothetical protein AAGI52_16260 [Bacteroidota bacterium]